LAAKYAGIMKEKCAFKSIVCIANPFDLLVYSIFYLFRLVLKIWIDGTIIYISTISLNISSGC